MALIAWYKLDDLRDYSGNGNHLEYVGSSGSLVPVANGKIGGAYERPAVNNGTDWLRSIKDVDLSGSFTMCCWAYVKACHMGSANGLVTNHNHNTNLGAGITVRTISEDDFRISCNTGNGTSRTYNAYYGTSNIKDRWAHLVVRYEKETNHLSLWVDGVKEYERSYEMATAPGRIGVFKWSLGYSSNSYQPSVILDDVRIYDHALSPKEIRELAKAKILHFKFDDFQEPTENFIPNGHFSNGQGIPSESGSNPVNEIVMLPNPGDSPWVLRQTSVGGSPSTEYEIHFKQGTQIQPNTTYCMSCWVAYTPDWDGNRQIFHARWYRTDGTNSTTNGSGTLVKTMEINGLTWEYRYLTFSTDALANGQFNWYLGYAANNTQGYRYITNVQLEPKAYPTPFVDGVRTGVVKDSSGYENHAALSISTTPQWSSDSAIGSGAYKFDGATQYIDIGRIGINATDDLTLAAWVKLDPDFSSDGCIIGGRRGDVTNLRVLPDRRLEGRQDDYAVVSSKALDLNKWHHVALTFKYDASTSNAVMKLYVDGEEAGTRNITGYDDTFTNIPMWIGWESRYNDYFKGLIDDVRVYKTALSAQDIKELYQQRASLDNQGNFWIHEIQEPYQPFPEIKRRFDTGSLSPPLGAYTQSNCQVELVSDHVRSGKYSYRIYRPPNLAYPGDGNTMWGGVRLAFYSGYERFVPGRVYRVSFYYKGQTTQPIEEPYFAYSIGWTSMGVGLQRGATLLKHKGLIPANFNDWSKWHHAECLFLADKITQVGTDGNTYYCMREFKIGWPYQDTGPLGTDIRIADITIEELDPDDLSIGLHAKGVFKNVSFNEVAVTENLEAWCPLSGNADDHSGKGRHGTVNGPVVVPAFRGRLGYEFDGVDDYIVLPNFQYPATWNDPFSISVWIYVPSDAIWSNGYLGNIVARGTYAGSHGLIRGTTDNQVRMWVRGSNTSLSAFGSIQRNTWHHIVGTWDGQTVRLYVDGVLVNSSSATLEGTPTSADWDVGRARAYSGDSGNWFKGRITDLRIYRRALSPQEVGILYKSSSPNPVPMQQTASGIYLAGQIIEV